MSPYNILSDIKSGRIQVKSMDSATILFFKCQRWEYSTFYYKIDFNGIIILPLLTLEYSFLLWQNER